MANIPGIGLRAGCRYWAFWPRRRGETRLPAEAEAESLAEDRLRRWASAERSLKEDEPTSSSESMGARAVVRFCRSPQTKEAVDR